MRAKIGTLTTATAKTICGNPRPSQATIPIASRIPGIASMTSTTRIRTESTRPPMPPAAAPIAPPMKTPMITEAMPATRLTWAPYRMRLYSSRPWRSVPMMCSREGVSSRSDELALLRPEGREEWGEEGRADEHRDEDHAQDRRPVAQQAPEGVAPQPAAGAGLLGQP